MLSKIIKKIIEYNKIIIHRHVRPDGDCLGSAFGLKYFIEANFKDKVVTVVGNNIPPYLSKVGISQNIDDSFYDGALVIVVDTANEERIEDSRYKNGDFLIKIDHHDDSPLFGDLSYIDPASAACSSIIVRMIKPLVEQGYVMPSSAAKALFFGITTDTGRFRYRGIDEELFCNAGWLLSHGVDSEELYTNLYIKDKEILALNGYVYNNFKITENGVAYFTMDRKTIRQFNVTKEDAANLISLLDSIKGSLIWVAFIDQMYDFDETKKDVLVTPHNEVRVRIRSRFVQINDIGAMFRGGGHLQASGATIYSESEKSSLLKLLDERLRTFKEEHKESF